MNINYAKNADGLVPAIIQDPDNGRVLMLGFMNEEAVRRTIETGRVTFFSRSRRQLWTKGETSGNYLEFISVNLDCDEDSLLIMARPTGPVCHTGSATCFGEKGPRHWSLDLLFELEALIDKRRSDRTAGSYVASLFDKGLNKIAQKVGEEAVEFVIESLGNDKEKITSEAADLIFHCLILLRTKGISFDEVVDELDRRRKS